jgi:hypothetical protein
VSRGHVAYACDPDCAPASSHISEASRGIKPTEVTEPLWQYYGIVASPGAIKQVLM